MSARRTWRPEQLWLVAAALALLLLAVLAAGYALRQHQQATQTLENTASRASRLAGLLQNEEQLTRLQAELQDNLSQYVWPADRELSDVGNAALQRVRALADSQGLRIASSQAQANARDEHGFDRIGLDVRIEGEWNAIVALLRELGGVRPALYLDTAHLSVLTLGDTQRPPILAAQIGLFVLRQRP
ncbi:MAG: GspMb/PilO family protein [Pseudomonadota bacterium]|nr:GspMb/PilO family protein [Pseudomonadota bacterium]